MHYNQGRIQRGGRRGRASSFDSKIMQIQPILGLFNPVDPSVLPI